MKLDIESYAPQAVTYLEWQRYARCPGKKYTRSVQIVIWAEFSLKKTVQYADHAKYLYIGK